MQLQSEDDEADESKDEMEIIEAAMQDPFDEDSGAGMYSTVLNNSSLYYGKQKLLLYEILKVYVYVINFIIWLEI